MGASESKVNRLVFIATKIVPEVRDLIRDYPVVDSQTDLLELAKCDPVQQKKIAQDLVERKIESVRVAVEQLAKQEVKAVEKGLPAVKEVQHPKVSLTPPEAKVQPSEAPQRLPVEKPDEKRVQSKPPEQAPKKDDTTRALAPSGQATPICPGKQTRDGGGINLQLKPAGWDRQDRGLMWTVARQPKTKSYLRGRGCC